MVTSPFPFFILEVSFNMEFIIDEAEIENCLYSDESSDNESTSSDDFLTDDEETVAENDESFYRSFDNRKEFHQFKNQIKNPVEEHQRSIPELFYGEDDLPEMYSPEDREHVESKERAANFKKTLKRFENHFFLFGHLRGHVLKNKKTLS